MLPAAESRFEPTTAIPLARIVGFFFCARSALTFALIQTIGANEQLGSKLAIALSLILLVLVVVDRLCTPHLRDSSPPPVMRWLFLYVGLAGGSLMWSDASSHLASFAYWCGTAADLMTTALLFRSAEPRRIAAVMMQGYISAASVIAAAAWIMPAEYDLRLGNQDYLNANTIANLAAFAFFFIQFLNRLFGTRLRIVSSFLALTILRSLSKTTTAAFAVSAALLFLADRAIPRRTKLLLACAVTATIFLMWGLFEAYYDIYTSTGTQAETLTGRTAIWAYVTDAIPARPLLGHGFDSMWKVVPTFGTFQARHAENEILQQLYCYGIAGLVLMTGIYSRLFGAVRDASSSPLRSPASCLLLYVLVRGLAEAEPFDLLLPVWTAILLGYLLHEPLKSAAAGAPQLQPLHIDVDHPIRTVLPS